MQRPRKSFEENCRAYLAGCVIVEYCGGPLDGERVQMSPRPVGELVVIGHVATIGERDVPNPCQYRMARDADGKLYYEYVSSTLSA